MKRGRKLFLCFLGFIALAIGIAFAIATFSPNGPSPLAFKVLRYETNANEIVAFVRMQNVSGRIIQYEGLRASKRLRCEYFDGMKKWSDPATGSSSFLHPYEAVVGEILLPGSEPVFVGVMSRELTRPMRFPGRFRAFFVGIEVRIRSMFDYKPIYLPEPLLQKPVPLPE